MNAYQDRSGPEVGQVDGDGVEGGDTDLVVTPKDSKQLPATMRRGIGLEGTGLGVYELGVTRPRNLHIPASSPHDRCAWWRATGLFTAICAMPSIRSQSTQPLDEIAGARTIGVLSRASDIEPMIACALFAL